jgi:hypothetical protein
MGTGKRACDADGNGNEIKEMRGKGTSKKLKKGGRQEQEGNEYTDDER